MDFALFTGEGFAFFCRWLHFFFGVIWIGLLYYFNFVQGSFMAETDGPTKSQVLQKLAPRALWWFRHSAMATFTTGWLIIAYRAHSAPGILNTSWGVSILTGATFGSLMWANVWFVIWPMQKVVIQNAVDVAGGKPANPDAANRAARALVTSRTNVMFSIPMLFFMGAASHLPILMDGDSKIMPFAVVIGTILVAAQANALKGKTGPLTTVRGVITSGFVLTAIVYVTMELLL